MTDERGTAGHGVPAEAGEDRIHLPHPSVWPVVCGVGITLAAFGVLTWLSFSVAGLLVLAWGLAGWIGELRHD